MPTGNLGSAVVDVSANTQPLVRELAQAEQQVRKFAENTAKAMAAPAVTFQKQWQQTMSSMQAQAVTFRRQMEVAAPGVQFQQQMKAWAAPAVTFPGDKVAQSTRTAAMGFLYLSQAVEDAQYGFSAIVNNIPLIVMGLGGSAGLAGGISIAAVATNQLIKHWDELKNNLKGTWLDEVRLSIEGLADSLKDLTQGTKEFREEAQRQAERADRGAKASAEMRAAPAQAQREQAKAVQNMVEKMGGGLIDALIAPIERTAGPGFRTGGKLAADQRAEEKRLLDRNRDLEKQLRAGTGPDLTRGLAFGGAVQARTMVEQEVARNRKKLEELGGAKEKTPYEKLHGELSILVKEASEGNRKSLEELQQKFAKIPALKTLFEQSFAKVPGAGPGKEDFFAQELENQQKLDKGLKDFFSKGKEAFQKRESERKARAAEARSDAEDEERSWKQFHTKEDELKRRIAEGEARQRESSTLGQSFGLGDMRQKIQKDLLGDDTAKRHLEIAKAQLRELQNMSRQGDKALLDRFGHAMGPE